MTREEAKVNAMNIAGEDVIEDGIIFLSLINEIYNDFESRTCENCKHVEYGDYMCCSLTDNAFSKGNRIFKAIVNDKISCTIYEAKEESK